jgi:RNA polymerase sigma factor (sigma-70 family)
MCRHYAWATRTIARSYSNDGSIQTQGFKYISPQNLLQWILCSLGNIHDALLSIPYVFYVRKMEHEQVREAIQQLPVDFREVILLREVEELSYQEIATILDCPPGTVMSRLARARAKLRTLLSAALLTSEVVR